MQIGGITQSKSYKKKTENNKECLKEIAELTKLLVLLGVTLPKEANLDPKGIRKGKFLKEKAKRESFPYPKIRTPTFDSKKELLAASILAARQITGENPIMDSFVNSLLQGVDKKVFLEKVNQHMRRMEDAISPLH